MKKLNTPYVIEISDNVSETYGIEVLLEVEEIILDTLSKLPDALQRTWDNGGVIPANIKNEEVIKHCIRHGKANDKQREWIKKTIEKEVELRALKQELRETRSQAIIVLHNPAVDIFVGDAQVDTDEKLKDAYDFAVESQKMINDFFLRILSIEQDFATGACSVVDVFKVMLSWEKSLQISGEYDTMIRTLGAYDIDWEAKMERMYVSKVEHELNSLVEKVENGDEVTGGRIIEIWNDDNIENEKEELQALLKLVGENEEVPYWNNQLKYQLNKFSTAVNNSMEVQ